MSKKRKDKEIAKQFELVYESILDDSEEEWEISEEEDNIEELEKFYSKSHSAIYKDGKKVSYLKELIKLQVQLIKMQDWIKATGYKLVVIFEGRDAAGKGGVIKRITQRLNPRICKVVALPAPSEREKTQWYFQRYVQHLPAAGEIVLFDRSWYNRAGVERVMGFCTEEEYWEFLNTVPLFEKMICNSGIHLVKYWFSISDKEQEFRFNCRIHDPLKHWKLSPMDLESRVRWEDYTKAKEIMFEKTHSKHAPWYIILANNKKLARLNCISHLLSLVPYEEIKYEKVTLPQRKYNEGYRRNPNPPELLVKEVYSDSAIPYEPESY
ncbi:MAG: polyphosphate kinase 2 [Leptospiraceae bacterium]|nr:polyphosphate kinase 2 [Leptospiraceae bacterium]